MNAVDTTLLEKKYSDILKTFSFRGQSIPDYMHYGIILYLVHRKLPGGFLTAILEGDLYQAVSRADSNNLNALVAYCGFFYNEAPSDCFGSKKKVERWLAGE